MAEDFISGALAGQEYQMNKLKLLEAPVKLEQEKLALKISQQSYDQRQKMADFLTQHSSKIPPGQDPLVNAAHSLMDVGNAELQSGMVEEGTATLAKASSITAQIENSAYKNWQMTIQQTKFADSLLAGVTDQKSLDQANAYVRMTTGQPSALEGKKYSPELIEALKKASETKRTQAQEALTKAQTAKAEADTVAERELVTLRKTQEALNTARTENLNKVGGGQIAKPRTVTAVTNAIRTSIGVDNIDSTTARTFADDIALDAEKRMQRDHQTLEQAVNSAVKFSKDHGTLAGIATAWTRLGQTPAKGLPLPTDASGYKDNMWYQAPPGGWPDTKTTEPRHYVEESKMLYPAGSGPGDKTEEEDEE
jgi:hypothetical protein